MKPVRRRYKAITAKWRIHPSQSRHTAANIVARQYVRQAINGDTDAALEILREFVAVVRQYDEHAWLASKPLALPWAYADHLATAFEKIVRAAMRRPNWQGMKWNDYRHGEAQADANRALYLKTSAPGRPKGAATHDEEALAAACALLCINGVKLGRARSELAESTCADTRTIERAEQHYPLYRQHRMAVKANQASDADKEFAAELFKVGAQPYLRQVRRILKKIRQESRRLSPVP